MRLALSRLVTEAPRSQLLGVSASSVLCEEAGGARTQEGEGASPTHNCGPQGARTPCRTLRNAEFYSGRKIFQY